MTPDAIVGKVVLPIPKPIPNTTRMNNNKAKVPLHKYPNVAKVIRMSPMNRIRSRLPFSRILAENKRERIADIAKAVVNRLTVRSFA
ncbi:hypothetical protein D3C76_1459440 [compost metagenome]